MVHAVGWLMLMLLLSLPRLLRAAAVVSHEVAPEEVPIRFGRRPGMACRMSSEMATHLVNPGTSGLGFFTRMALASNGDDDDDPCGTAERERKGGMKDLVGE